jgi:hypothetical protein
VRWEGSGSGLGRVCCFVLCRSLKSACCRTRLGGGKGERENRKVKEGKGEHEHVRTGAPTRKKFVPFRAFFYFYFFWNPVLYTACVPKTQERSPEGSTVYMCVAGIAVLSVCVMANNGGGRVVYSTCGAGLNRAPFRSFAPISICSLSDYPGSQALRGLAQTRVSSRNRSRPRHCLGLSKSFLSESGTLSADRWRRR